MATIHFAVWKRPLNLITHSGFSRIHFNSLYPSDTIWRHRSRSTLTRLMACCLMAPSHYPNQCWLIISEVLWHSRWSSFTGNARDMYAWYEFEDYWFKIPTASHRSQWVKDITRYIILNDAICSWNLTHWSWWTKLRLLLMNYCLTRHLTPPGSVS